MSNPLPQVGALVQASLPVVELVGDARTRGLLQGQRARASWSQAYDSVASVLQLTGRLPETVSRRAISLTFRATGAFYFYQHRRDLSESLSTGLSYLQGMAEGAGVSERELYGIAASEVSLTPGWALGCTALSFSAQRTKDRKPLLAYNHDYPTELAPHLILKRSRGPDCKASLALTYSHISGCLGGINEAGLALTLNAGYARCRGQGSGLLGTLAAQRCLDECGSVEDAVELFRATRFVSGCILALSDATGDAAVVEAAPMSVQVRRPKNGFAHAFNKYHHPISVKNEVPLGAVSTGVFGRVPIHVANLSRELRLAQLNLSERVLDRDEIIRLLSDHNEGPGTRNTICAHGAPHQQTLASLLLFPETRSLQAAWGRPCQTHFVEHRL